jgi:Protein of unknown function (DUF3515)
VNPRILATVIAVPVAVLTGVVVYNLGMPAASSSPDAQATSPATVSATTLGERPAVVCQALVAKLPSTVRTKQRRPVTAGAEQNAAYGDPALTLQCGVAPATYPPTDDLYLLDSVCWHSRLDGDTTVWTTVDREVPVRVTVPGPADGASQWAIAFSRSIAENVPSLKAIPSGCESLTEPLPSSSS